MTKEIQTGTGVVLEASRREKLRKIEEIGFDPWGQRFDDHIAIGTIRAMEDQIVVDETTQHSTGPKVCAAGRIVLQRKKGKLIFLDLWDWTGKIQILIGSNQVGEQNWELAQCFDLGDIIGVNGELMRTRTGELSIAATQLTFLTKSIETPPDKFHGLTDPDLRSRMRYLDLIHTDGVLERMLRRTKIVQSVRNTLAGEGFVEVEGPTLHTIAGGAAARPFATHHNALDIPLVMRIALELHLKRLLVGGMERVYELGRVYRNEGIDPRHNPEFTMLEAYQAYGDYRSMMDLTEKIILDALQMVHLNPLPLWGRVRVGASRSSTNPHPNPLPGGEGTFIITWNGNEIDFTPPFARKTYDSLIKEHTGIDPTDSAAIVEYAKSLNLDVADKHPDVVKNDLFEEKVEKNLVNPTFVMDYPASICPLTKRKKDQPDIAERFELFVQGMELANAYTELNDPDLQEKLFSQQLEGQKADESMARMDRDFIRALRHGMPPAGGLGIGIDRLCMLLTDTAFIREVILFPLQRPEN
jgi:lysyl-tRNA synthetase class 2